MADPESNTAMQGLPNPTDQLMMIIDELFNIFTWSTGTNQN
jgi:hypothetical protein